MANANGVPFFFYFILKIHLIFIWRKAMSNNPKRRRTISIFRYFLWIVTLSSGLDDIRYFLGSILPEPAAASNAWKGYTIYGFAAHLILLPVFWMIGVTFLSFPNHFRSNPFPQNKICFGLLWIVILLNYAMQQIVGICAFFVMIQHLVLSTEHRIYRWTVDSEWWEDQDSIALLVGNCVAIFISLWMELVFGMVWWKHKNWRPFAIGLCCIVGQGITPMISDTVFFYTSNLWEYIFFLALFQCDRWLYGPRSGFLSVAFHSFSDDDRPGFSYVSMETTQTDEESRKHTYSEYNI